MFEHDTTLEEAVRFSRFDEDNPLSTVSKHSFILEEYEWPSAEHYYQAHKFENMSYAPTILSAPSGKEAYELGNRWFKRKVVDWKTKRRVWMTRALYRKVMEYDDVKAAVLETGESLIIETSMYDHYWGVARDLRGENTLGKIWMDIRKKINEST